MKAIHQDTRDSFYDFQKNGQDRDCTRDTQGDHTKTLCSPPKDVACDFPAAERIVVHMVADN